MKSLFFCFNIYPLYLAVERQNVEIVKLLLRNDTIDVNSLNIFI